MRGKWLLFSGIVILVAIAAGALSLLRKPTAEPVKKAAVVAPPEETTTAGDEINLMGTIRAAHIVPVPSSVDGVVETWEVELGQEVLQGQLIGRIRNSSLETAKEGAQLDLERAQTRVTNLEGQILAARLEAARTDADAVRTRLEMERLEKAWARQQMLFKEGATPRLTYEKTQKDYTVSKAEAETSKQLATGATDRVSKLERDLQTAKSAVEDKQADLDTAQDAIDSCNIMAPADGVIIKLSVDVGGEVDKAMPDLVQLAVDPALLQIVIRPDKRALERMKEGLPALVIVPDVSAEALSGEVEEVGEEEVIIGFTSPNSAIKHGMPGSVRVKLAP
ncbi:MAG: biotin/lipoyl-binding protein [Acidobacteria bacterium]|nr:biotin/lipoyl-binding protein [Acidobacteriota bacterium]